MTELYLTAYDGAFLGPVARVLGWIMDKIYLFLSSVFGLDSIALTIVVFTIFIYLCLFPLTYKQQKFSVLTRKMNPEMEAIKKKYKNRKDQESMAAQQEEQQMIYDKYGISPMGSCLQMVIQMPILFALYRVFYNVPAYIGSVKGIFTDLVSGIMGTSGYADAMQQVFKDAHLRNVIVDFSTKDKTVMGNYIVDVLYKLNDNGWDALTSAFPKLSDAISQTAAGLHDINYFFVVNISDTPWNMIKTGWAGHDYLLLICALMFPVLSYLSQLANIKLMPTASGDDNNDAMAKQMKTMNMMMPIMSLFIAFSCPAGLVLYWIVGAVVRIVQQYFLNRHFEKIDLEAIVEKNRAKAEKKKEKRGIRQSQIYEAAKMNTKNSSMSSKSNLNQEREAAINKANELRSSAKSGSLASKANIVKDFNEKNNK